MTFLLNLLSLILFYFEMISFCPVLSPSYEEFINFQAYVNQVQEKYSKTYGIVKIIPPAKWQSKSKQWSKILKSIKVKNPEYQSLRGEEDKYYFQCKNQILKKILPISEYQNQARLKEKENQDITKIQILQQKSYAQFWENIHTLKKELYCANINSTLMDKESGQWDFNNLNSMFKKAIDEPLEGLNSPFIFVGAWKTFFNWHIQQLQLSAINIVHSGAVKVWYGIHPKDQRQFERVSGELFPKQAKKCPLFMRHKSTYINPYKLLENYPHLRITKMFQGQNEISIAFSGGYHCGFNTGYNVAEAVNYSVDSWLNKFVNFKGCKCDKRIGVIVQNQDIINNLQKNNQYERLQVKHAKQLKILSDRARKQLEQDEEYEKIDKNIVYTQFLQHKTKKINKHRKFIWIQKYKRFFPSDYQQEKYIIDTHIQCDRCKKWQTASQKVVDTYENRKFACSQIGKKCMKKKMI